MNYNEIKFKKDRIAHMKFNLQNNLRWALKGLTTIYKYQTADEQATQSTREHNNVGFSGCDGEILSSFAEQVNAGRTLSPKQVALLHRKMPKYARQLDNIAMSQEKA